jgi:hypothetical protein
VNLDSSDRFDHLPETLFQIPRRLSSIKYRRGGPGAAEALPDILPIVSILDQVPRDGAVQQAPSHLGGEGGAHPRHQRHPAAQRASLAVAWALQG